VFNFGMVGEDAYNIFRIENGIPVAPNELNDSVNPIEVNLDEEISKQKHNYIGHENIEDEENELSRLVKIKFKNGLPNKDIPFPIFSKENKEIGIITSVGNADIISSPIGLGFIDRNFNLNGNSYFIQDEKDKFEIEICELNKS